MILDYEYKKINEYINRKMYFYTKINGNLVTEKLKSEVTKNVFKSFKSSDFSNLHLNLLSFDLYHKDEYIYINGSFIKILWEGNILGTAIFHTKEEVEKSPYIINTIGKNYFSINRSRYYYKIVFDLVEII